MSIATVCKRTVRLGFQKALQLAVILGLIYVSYLFWLPPLVPFLEDRLLFLSQSRRQFTLTPTILQEPTLKTIRRVQIPTRLIYHDRQVFLNGLFSPARPGKPTIILSNGNGGSLDAVAGFAPLLAQGVGLLLYEYPGYGQTAGKPTEMALYRSLAAVRTYARNAGVPNSEQVLYGLSIGGAVTVESATRQPAKAVILQSTMTRFPDVVRSVMGKDFCTVLPLDRAALTQFNSLAKIHALRSPLLILHGAQDTLMPPRFAHRLAQAAIHAQPRRTVILPGGHNLLPQQTLPFIEGFLAGL